MQIIMTGPNRQEHRGCKMLRDIGRCIYCGENRSGVKLSKEHVIPYSLGADVYLKKASCPACAETTQKFEMHVARNIFGHHRIHKGGPTRNPEQRPDELPTHILIRGSEQSKNLPIKDHPYFLAAPIWAQPGILRGVEPTEDFEGLFAHLYYHVPESIRDTLSLSDGELAEIRPDSSGDVKQFGRAIAKIAFCNAIGTLGIDGFDPLDLPDLILGKFPAISYYVGSLLQIPPPPTRLGPLHRIDLGWDWVCDPRTKLWRRYLISNIRLFATDGTDNEGMPVYTVVVGAVK